MLLSSAWSRSPVCSIVTPVSFWACLVDMTLSIYTTLAGKVSVWSKLSSVLPVACASFSYTGLGLARVACLRGQLRRSYWSFTSRIVTKPDQSVVGSASGGGTIPALLRMSKKLAGRLILERSLIFPASSNCFPVSSFREQIADRVVSCRGSADSTCVRRLIA